MKTQLILDYVQEEETDSEKDIFTSLVRIKGSNYRVIPVKTNMPIDKKLFMKCSKALSRVNAGAPIKIGDIVCKNILNTGIDIICTKNAEKKVN